MLQRFRRFFDRKYVNVRMKFRQRCAPRMGPTLLAVIDLRTHELSIEPRKTYVEVNLPDVIVKLKRCALTMIANVKKYEVSTGLRKWQFGDELDEANQNHPKTEIFADVFWKKETPPVKVLSIVPPAPLVILTKQRSNGS
tara:strand:+ start:421 stop:840 length:420 start_codon:yes stop_codon:yes gene_type:complete